MNTAQKDKRKGGFNDENNRIACDGVRHAKNTRRN